MTTLSEKISEHLKKKNVLYEKVLKNAALFVSFLDAKFPDVRSARPAIYGPEHCKVVVVYASLNVVQKSWKDDAPNLKFMDFHILKYFAKVASQIRKSSRFELYNFLGLSEKDIGEKVLSSSEGAGEIYRGSILPEGQSHFEAGYKVVSFYVDPEALLRRCYVLRKDGWMDHDNLYQRMIHRNKIEAIRAHLLHNKRVFINNIVVTLPSNTKLTDQDGNTDPLKALTKTTPIRIELPSMFNSVGIIDGQHRVFSYYEGGAREEEIAVLRKQQNLLVTGIVYPKNISALDRTKFEAKLFLEINATQTNPRSDLKQSVDLLLRPFSPVSIARRVVNRLNENGPLAGKFEMYFFDKGKVKTTSVVSYGLKQLVKLQGNDSFFFAWDQTGKDELLKYESEQLLDEYIAFCAKHVNLFVSAVKLNVPPERWTSDKNPGRLLSTTNVNGFIVCLRRIIEKDKLRTFDYYKNRLKGVSDFKFDKYKSSHYGALGDAMFSKYFSS